ncbi:hypothetical protein ABIC83_002489 [Roseateles asaccharophilus]|uniref:hypothetical protein n=1 Tax=Roseateles asaccharophilus TaxID=582607 RepID=UPI003838082E
MSDFNYQLNCGQYVLHQGDTPIHKVLDEVGIAFDSENGVMLKHGDPEFVSQWAERIRKKFRDGGFAEMAAQVVYIAGRFPLDDLNRCLTTTGYVLKLYERLQAGTLPQQELPKPLPAPAAARPVTGRYHR